MKETHISSTHILIALSVCILLGVMYLIYRDISFQKRINAQIGYKTFQEEKKFYGGMTNHRCEKGMRGNKNNQGCNCPMNNSQQPTPSLQ